MKALNNFTPFAPPYLGDEETKAVAEALQSGWISTGPRTRDFEAAFKELVGAESALALNSCTAGLHLGLKTLGVGPGDEVITTPMTFCATANVIEHLGGTTVLADIDPDTLLIDPGEIERRITKKTKVILPVHYAGQAADMRAINAIAKKHGIKVLEDAAHGPQIEDHGEVIGGGNNLTAFSFYATKNMTTAEGGMLTGPEEWVEKARMLSLHGMSKDAWKRFQKGGSWKYDVPQPGYKYNMTDIQASMGLVQLKKLNQMREARIKQFAIYNEVFKGCDLLSPLGIRAETVHSLHLFVIKLNLEKLKIDRDAVITRLTDLNVGTSVHYIPIHHHSYYQAKYNWTSESFPKASDAFSRILSLPLSPKHEEKTIRNVAEILLELLESEAI